MITNNNNNNMQHTQFCGCKVLAVVIVLSFSLIYYHQTLTVLAQLHQRSYSTEATSTLEQKLKHEGTTTSKRIKRFLISQGGGVVKLVLGISFPIVMADKKRSLNYFYNFQMQYAPPIIPLYWWSIYNTTTFAARTNLRKRSMDMLSHHDADRTLIYEFLEAIFERSGNPGRECLLTIICELAYAPLIEEDSSRTQLNTNDGNEIVDDYGRNIYHKLINAIFTPLHPNVPGRYLRARAAGLNGANCHRTFGKCLIVRTWFQRFTKYI